MVLDHGSTYGSQYLEQVVEPFGRASLLTLILSIKLGQALQIAVR